MKIFLMTDQQIKHNASHGHCCPAVAQNESTFPWLKLPWTELFILYGLGCSSTSPESCSPLNLYTLHPSKSTT